MVLARVKAGTAANGRPRGRPRKTTAAPKPRRRKTGKDSESVYPQELLDKVAELEKRISSTAADEINKMVQIGRDCQAIKKAYQVQYAELTKLFTMGRNEVRPCIVLAERYTDDEIDKFMGLKNKSTGVGLNRAHMTALSRVGEKGEAFRLAKEAVDNRWGKRELVAAVTKYRRDTGQRGGGGRAMKGVGSLRELFQQINKLSTEWVTRETQVWRAKRGGFDALMAKAVSDGTDVGTLSELDQTIATVNTLSTRVNMMYAELNLAARKLSVGTKPAAGEDASE